MANGIRFRRIDETNIGHHSYITGDDQCYFLFEYTSHKDYSYSATNNLISNFKKKPGIASFAELRYKAAAIYACGAYLAGAISHDGLRGWTIVPVPPSKARDHPQYDDRVLRFCRAIRSPHPIDIREFIYQTESLAAAHEAQPGARPTVAELLRVYRIDERLAQPPPTAIVVVDDVLTVGTHYRAAHRILSDRFPGVVINGMFIARRVFPPDEAADDFTI